MPGPFDIIIFSTFFGLVIATSMYKSRRERTSEDYFLAGRGLKWYLIGFSIVAANLSTEQFVGMSGASAGNIGLAVSGYQLLGAVTIVFVAIFFLPRFLRAGIYTMPEYLEYRYSSLTRGIMAFYTVVIYVFVLLAAVIYSGALTLHTIFDMDLTMAAWLIGFLAALYTAWGGLKAVAVADLFQGSALLLGGLLTMILGFREIGGVRPFLEANADRLHMVLPSDHPEIPWTALVIGLWIPNFYYCGLNQFIVQRTLAAKTLRQGQLGIIFAAALWLIVPFVIVMPGIMALQLYGNQLETSDQAYPVLIRNLIPVGLRGFIFAALAGAVISSLASMLNSAATISTMDLYKRYLRPQATQEWLVDMGRVLTIVFVLIGCAIAPHLANPQLGGVFKYIQEFQGFISPGILAAFVFGFLVRSAPPAAGTTALLANVPIYGLLYLFCSGIYEPITVFKIAFLNRMAITFVVLIGLMTIITLIRPLREMRIMPVREDIDMSTSPTVVWLGSAVILGVIIFYIIFW
ncbi:MAG: solute:sodium symporter family transporter [Sedimentisphaerales bacterium]|nr:solute:sodium symporter family transporter [Sedimentisphaerales bacterium]